MCCPDPTQSVCGVSLRSGAAPLLFSEMLLQHSRKIKVGLVVFFFFCHSIKPPNQCILPIETLLTWSAPAVASSVSCLRGGYVTAGMGCPGSPLPPSSPRTASLLWSSWKGKQERWQPQWHCFVLRGLPAARLGGDGWEVEAPWADSPKRERWSCRSRIRLEDTGQSAQTLLLTTSCGIRSPPTRTGKTDVSGSPVPDSAALVSPPPSFLSQFCFPVFHFLSLFSPPPFLSQGVRAPTARRDKLCSTEHSPPQGGSVSRPPGNPFQPAGGD